MKKTGSVLDFTEQRNAALLRTMRTRMLESRCICMAEIFREVAESPAERFWVSEERACDVFVKMITGKQLPKMNPNKREMFGEIYRRVLVLFDKRPESSIIELVREVVYSPAPKFYLTPRSVGEYICRIKKRNRENDIR